MFTDNLRINSASERKPLSDVTYKMNFNENECLLLYVKSGRGRLLLGDVVYRIAEGSFAVCRQTGIKYRFSKKYPVEAFFINFSGEVSILPCGVYRCFDTANAQRLLLDITKEFMLKKSHYEENLSAMLTSLLCRLSRSTQREADTEKVLDLLAEDIHKNYLTDKIDVDKYAQMLSVSKDRLSVIFKKRFGLAPYKYQVTLKMNDATDLLLHTDLSVGEISEKLGFANPLYFSSAYKKQVGVTPTEMRKSRDINTEI